MSKAKPSKGGVAVATKKKVKVKGEEDKRGASNGTVTKQKKGRKLLFPNWDKSDDDEEYLNGLKQSEFLRSKLEECYDRKVSIQEDALREYNQIFSDIINSLLPKLQRNTSRVRCLDPVYVGSSVDDLMVKPHIHYDVQVPICVVGRVTVEHVRSGLVTMRVPPVPSGRAKEDRWAGWRSPDNFLSPILANEMMYKFVLQWMSMRDLPNIAVDDYEPGSVICIRIGDEISIDITPMIDLKRKEDPYPYLAKPFRYEREPKSEYYWRISCFEREKELLQTIKRADGGYRFKALKILKALRHDDAALRHLTTYHMKTVLLHMCDGQVDNFKWQKHKTECCFMSLLEQLREAVQKRHLRHFVLTDVDIFENIPENVMVAIGNRLKILCSRERELGRLLDK
ncbi:cyclic GMP-AMP synthase-like [Ptychodera flava]|uniref:cyclic GMP-AMP synthase-like n=1 Tax=Ptychodera flava TaxID=63121 RepID=UPI003969BC33